MPPGNVGHASEYSGTIAVQGNVFPQGSGLFCTSSANPFEHRVILELGELRVIVQRFQTFSHRQVPGRIPDRWIVFLK
jgi:hypothetical protein